MTRPEVVLLAAEWQPRALIRAQLIEEGLDVVATDNWLALWRELRPGSEPRIVIVDLKGLADPQAVLDDLRNSIGADRVLVLDASGTVSRAELERLGFHLVTRPISIAEIVRAAARLVRSKALP